MARFDKYDPKDGGFRAVLGFAPVAGDVGTVIPVDINGSGRVIKSVDGTGAEGVICLSSLLAQGDPVDVMTDGEIVDVFAGNIASAPAAGAVIKAGAGVVGSAAAGKKVGRLLESWRLVVRFGRS